MKKLSLILSLVSLMTFLNCGPDDPEPECIECKSFDPDIILENEVVCIGDDNGFGAEVTRSDLDEVKRFFDAVNGVECTLK